MKYLGILFMLFIAAFSNAQQNQIPEQIALDYFFKNFFSNDFSDYKVIEFEQQTKTNGYYGIILDCEGYDHSVLKEIEEAKSENVVTLNADKSPVKVRRMRAASPKLKIRVFSKKDIRGRHFIYITGYRKLRFVEYYIFEIDKESLTIINICKASEII